jgi:hypothetical protein
MPSFTVTGITLGETLKLREEPPQHSLQVGEILHNANCVNTSGSAGTVRIGQRKVWWLWLFAFNYRCASLAKAFGC